MIKSVFAATQLLSMSAGALAGPYVNVETNQVGLVLTTLALSLISMWATKEPWEKTVPTTSKVALAW